MGKDADEARRRITERLEREGAGDELPPHEEFDKGDQTFLKGPDDPHTQTFDKDGDIFMKGDTPGNGDTPGGDDDDDEGRPYEGKRRIVERLESEAAARDSDDEWSFIKGTDDDDPSFEKGPKVEFEKRPRDHEDFLKATEPKIPFDKVAEA